MNIVSPIASIIDKMITKKVTTQILTALGLLSIPYLGPMLSVMLGAIVDSAILWLLTKTIIGGARIFVLQNVDWNVKNVEDATQQIKDLLDNPTKYTAEQQAEMEKQFDEAAVKLIKIINARVTI